MQRRIMFALPFVFVIFIINFEAGLIVYWITTNVWTIGQQLLVKKLYPKPAPAEPGDDTEAAKPARGKPPSPKPATAAAVAGGSSSKQRGGQKAPASKGSGGGGNGGPAKAPPPSPRKKKKRSGRRR
jgi:YidC/Oxa1 family membrane protein insertase